MKLNILVILFFYALVSPSSLIGGNIKSSFLTTFSKKSNNEQTYLAETTKTYQTADYNGYSSHYEIVLENSKLTKFNAKRTLEYKNADAKIKHHKNHLARGYKFRTFFIIICKIDKQVFN